MNGESLNIQEESLNKLQQLFPDVFSEGKIDWEKFKATFSNDINFNNERYVLNWAGKADAFKVLQIPTTATLKPCPGEGINDGFSPSPFGEGRGEVTQNVFIEGENLEVLKVLQKAYYGKIKVIEIDPPYNTGSDSFIYPDSFKENKADYEKRIGDKDEEGYLMKEGMFRKNSKDSGHYHSNWLSMMYPRLFLAKNLLRDDGVIFVHIDDNEQHNLRLLMNEIFGEENFVANFIWKKKGTTTNVEGAKVSSLTEFILCYGKNESPDSLNYRVVGKETRLYDFTDDEGAFRKTVIEKKNTGGYERKTMQFEILGQKPREGKRWQIGEDTAKILDAKNRFIIEEGIVKLKIYDFEDRDTTSANPNILFEHGSTDSASKDLEMLMKTKGLFDNPKPKELITKLISLAEIENRDDIILDFFGGSGTTAQAVLEQNKKDGGNRKFILVQLPELTDENSEAYKAGYKTIADISKERIRRVIKRLNHDLPDSKITMIKDKNQQQLFDAKENQVNQTNPINHGSDNGFKVFKLSPSNFKIWRGNEITEENLVTQLDAFTNPVKEESKADNMLYELMLKAGYLLTDKVETKGKYYSVNDGELIIALEELNQKIIDSIIAAQPKKVITLDNLFTGNDQLKTNTVLQMKDAGIYFKTI
ncbi:MAG TPA: site-specific DNA-methyltransferase [Chitinophagaceae bacterium]